MQVPVVISLIKRLKQVQLNIERLYKQMPHNDPRLLRLKKMRLYLLDKLHARRVPLDRYIVQPDLLALPVSPTSRPRLPKRSGGSWPPVYNPE